MTKKERLIFRKRRKGLRISQAQLAQQASVSRTKVAKWENGTLNLTAEEEGRLKDVLSRVLIKRGTPEAVTPEQAQQDLRDGAILARLRAEHGITQAQLANKAKIDQGTISHFEKGDLELTPTRRGQLFQAIDAIVEERRTSIPSGFANLADLRSAQAYETWKKTPGGTLQSAVPVAGCPHSGKSIV